VPSSGYASGRQVVPKHGTLFVLSLGVPLPLNTRVLPSNFDTRSTKSSSPQENPRRVRLRRVSISPDYSRAERFGSPESIRDRSSASDMNSPGYPSALLSFRPFFRTSQHHIHRWTLQAVPKQEIETRIWYTQAGELTISPTLTESQAHMGNQLRDKTVEE